MIVTVKDTDFLSTRTSWGEGTLRHMIVVALCCCSHLFVYLIVCCHLRSGVLQPSHILKCHFGVPIPRIAHNPAVTFFTPSNMHAHPSNVGCAR